MATTLNTHIDQLRPPAAYGRWTASALTADSSVVRTQEERA